MNIVSRVVVSMAIRVEARVLANRAFGSVQKWESHCRIIRDSTERNRRVLDAIYSMYPESRRQIDWPVCG
jgi:hypothetical protein